MKATIRISVTLAVISLCFPKQSIPQHPLTNPYTIYRKHYEAIGGLQRIKNIKSSYTEGTSQYDGLKGIYREWQEGPQRFRREENFDLFKRVSGDDGRFSWIQDSNGKTLVQRDEETLQRRELQLRAERFEHLDPNSGYFNLSFEGKQPVDDSNCYVIKISNTINQDINWNLFDEKTFFLRKAVNKTPDYEAHTLYSDYRRVEGGILVAYNTDTRIFPREKRELTRLTDYRANIPIDSSLFRIPARSVRDFHFSNGNSAENIAFLFVENNIFLRVKINENSEYWMVDSGASKSIVDADYAKQIGLKSKGKIKGFGFGGNFDLSFVRIPGYEISELRFDPQTIFSFSGLADRFYAPGAQGILGFDFLSRFVVKIDFAKQLFSFYDPDSFEYSGPGEIIDAPLKNNAFSVPVLVDGKYKGRWSIDLGAYNSSFHYPFAQSHDLLNRRGIETISTGMAGSFVEKIIQFDTLQVNGFVISKPLLNVPSENIHGTSTVGELAGNIGNSILRHFVVYLDYEKQRVILEKGINFNRRFARDKSGMVIGTLDNGLAYIAYVAPESPAQRAGIKPDDIIQTIDGKDIDDLGGLVSIKNLMRRNSGSRYKLAVTRRGQTKSLELILDDLF